LDSLESTPQEPTGRQDDPAFTLRWTFQRADLQDAVRGQPAFRRLRRGRRRLLLAALLVCVLFRVPADLVERRLAGRPAVGGAAA
jgi:hypothetical protein